MPDKATTVKTIIANRAGVNYNTIRETQMFLSDLRIDPNDDLLLTDFQREWPTFSKPGYKNARVTTVGEAVIYIINNT